MAIRIVRVNDRYEVHVDLPDGSRWHSAAPLTATEVLAELSSRGCHSTDVTDALSAADPSWHVQHDAEVLRQRGKTP